MLFSHGIDHISVRVGPGAVQVEPELRQERLEREEWVEVYGSRRLKTPASCLGCLLGALTPHLCYIFILLSSPLSLSTVQKPPWAWNLISHSDSTSRIVLWTERVFGPHQHEVGLDGRNTFLRIEDERKELLFLLVPDSFPCQGF